MVARHHVSLFQPITFLSLCISNHKMPVFHGVILQSDLWCVLCSRLLRKLKLDRFYPGKKKLDGNMFRSNVQNVQWRPGQKIYRPFKCLLDVGLARTSSGARVFGALKGAVDGGLDIPHSEKRFPGFTKGEGEDAKGMPYGSTLSLSLSLSFMTPHEVSSELRSEPSV